MKITIKSKVTDDSIAKSVKMVVEYHNYQTYLQSNCETDVPLYSATKQQAQRVLRRIKQPKPEKEYPLILRGDLIEIRKDRLFEGVYWIHIPMYPKSINLRIHTSFKYNLNNYTIQKCKLIRTLDKWYIFITVEKDDWLLPSTDNVLAIDLGCKNIATTVNTANAIANYYGRKLREIRGFYFNLRRRLGKKKAFETIKTIGHREFLQINHDLHKISKAIIEEAKRTNAVIVIRKLKGVRKGIKGGRRIKRILNNFPYYKLLQQIIYKAHWAGILVVEVGEPYTSQTCSYHDCHHRSKTSRETQGLFKCKKCQRELNANCNGARNILQRGLGVLSNLGGFLTYPKNDPISDIRVLKPPVIVEGNKMIIEEPQAL